MTIHRHHLQYDIAYRSILSCSLNTRNYVQSIELYLNLKGFLGRLCSCSGFSCYDNFLCTITITNESSFCWQYLRKTAIEALPANLSIGEGIAVVGIVELPQTKIVVCWYWSEANGDSKHSFRCIYSQLKLIDLLMRLECLW